MENIFPAEPVARADELFHLPRRGPGTYDRRQSTEARRAEQRRRLIAGAAAVFARDGYAGASVASVVMHSNLCRGTFYRNFSDVSAIFVATRQAAADLVFERVRDAVAAQPVLEAKTAAGIRAFLELLAEEGDMLRVLLREAPHCGDAHETLHRETVQRFAQLFRRGLTEALARGRIRSMPADPTIYAVIYGIAGIARHYADAHEEHRAIEVEPALLDLCRRAFC
jgi:AcrR family transcriptional regulator